LPVYYTRPVASMTHDISAFARSSNQVAGAKLVSPDMSQ
jgi:hypothetical protein